MFRILLITLAFTAALSAQSPDDRYAFVRDDKLGFINSAGTEVIPPQFFPIADLSHFSEGLAGVQGPDGAGYIDPSGRFVIGPQRVWGEPRPFHKGVAVVLIWATNKLSLNTQALIDRTGRVIRSGDGVRAEILSLPVEIRPQPPWVVDSSEGMTPVEVQGQWGFADPSGKIVIPPQFIAVKHFWRGLAQVAWPDGHGYIDKKGRVVWKNVQR